MRSMAKLGGALAEFGKQRNTVSDFLKQFLLAVTGGLRWSASTGTYDFACIHDFGQFDTVGERLCRQF